MSVLRHRSFPLWLLGIFIAFAAAMGLHPLDRQDWLLENALTLLCILILFFSHRWFPLSNISYTLIFTHLCLHTVGAHYTYSLVPYEQWCKSIFGHGINEVLGVQRNYYDRLVHFAFGLLWSYPIREMFLRIAGVRGLWGYYLPLDVTMSFSMLYELFEWRAAVRFGGDLGAAFLGSQGDPWDAQKDMAIATLGAVVTMAVVAFINWRFNKSFGQELRESFLVRGQPLGEVALEEMKRALKSGIGPRP